MATEHDLDPVPSFVAALVVFDGLVARLSSWDAGRYSLIYKGLTEPIRVIPGSPNNQLAAERPFTRAPAPV